MRRLPLLLTAVVLLVSCGYHDMRTEALKVGGVTPEAAQRGRALLARAVEAHGGWERWQSFTTAEVTLRDEWNGVLGRRVLNPWPANNLQQSFQVLLGSFNSRVEFLEGEHKGEIWGLQSWKSYKQPPGSEPVFEPDRDIHFYLPTYQYFLELPFRIPRAPLVAYTGERSTGGRTYELVFATWEKPEPHAAHDQYLVWINKETGLIELLQYTVRDFARFISGTNQFTDFRTVEGVVLPFRQTIANPGEEEDFLHRIVIEEIKFDTVPRQALLPEPSLPLLGDEKVPAG